jgi:predicted permease
MICGYICRKLGIIDNTSSKNLSKLIITVGQPMMIIGALNNATFTPENLKIALWAALIGVGMHMIMGLVAFLLYRKGKDVNHAKLMEFGMVFTNCGFLGFPILDSIYGGNIGSFMGAFYLISFNVFLWTWGIIILAREREDIKLTPKKAILNYGTVPCAIGIAFYLLKFVFQIPQPIGSFFNYLGSLCTPISVLITGGLLATISLKEMFKNKSLYVFSFLKLLVIPAVVCVLAKLIGLSDTYIILCTVMAGLPCASTVTMLAELHDIEPAYASQTVGMSSVLSTATLPLVMLFAQWICTL